MGIFKVSPLRKRQFWGGLSGLALGVGVILFLSLKTSEEYVSLGPMNNGHNEISCAACHTDANGNLSQQIQSNMAHAFGMRENGVDFGTKDVTVKNCLECHDRPNDRHPTYRFSEPRFRKVIKKIDATTCITCHTEHNGERVSVAAINYCMNCHQDLEVENDPVNISHVKLIANEQWFTCIQCHDFHGNHRYNVPTKLQDTIPLKIIQNYLDGGEDPYGKDKKYLGLSEPEWIKTLQKK
ncbi:cytochrome c3 family protein [Zobellia uliginosa]|uniref:cytochrome c3 family protein n=1 Tax=Zobellia uliginosa TaxID=143224 RepID=UPI0020908F29|nr:cytochrome c3 family protein [Zobellia uliginosa]